MFGLKSSLCFAFAAVFIAPSYQKPVDVDVDTIKRAVENVQTNDGGKVNNSGAANTPLVMDKTRTAYYPNSEGVGYYSLGQMKMPIQHYPVGMPYQTYQAPIMNGMMFKNEDASRSEPRTLGHLRPSLYSQYQSAPLAGYSYPIQAYHVQPYSYEYSSPLISGYGGHYSSGYSSYPYYRDAEEESKPRQLNNIMMPQKYISPVAPGVQYTSKYLMGKPFDSYEGLMQPQMMQPMLIRNAMPEWIQRSGEMQGRGLAIDDQLQMQIPNNYLLEKLQNYNPEVQSMPAQQVLNRAAEEPKPFEWNQMLSQQSNFKNGGYAQQIQDPYIAPEDGVFIEPYNEQHHPQASRSVEQPMYLASYPNQEQQLRIAQIQYYHNVMNNAADHLEPLNREYVNQRMFQPNFQSQAPMDPLAAQRMFLNNVPMVTRSTEEHQHNNADMAAKLQSFTKSFESFLENNKDENKDIKKEIRKDDKKDNVAAKQSEISNANGQPKRT